jgi:hypothetical protein
MQQARDHAAALGAAAGAATWPQSLPAGAAASPEAAASFLPTAGGAIALLQRRALAVGTAAGQPGGRAGGGMLIGSGGGAASGPPPWGCPTLAALMQHAGPPTQQDWALAIGGATAQSDADAVAGRAARGHALRRLAGRTPAGALPALPGQLAPGAGRPLVPSPVAKLAAFIDDGRQRREQLQPGAAAAKAVGWRRPNVPCGASAAGAVQQAAAAGTEAEADAEGDLVAIACLALQGVCSAVRQLGALAAGQG